MSSTSWWCRFLSLSDNWWHQKLRHWTEVLAGQKGCPSIVEDTILFAVQTYQRRRSLGLLWALVQFGWWGCPESCGCILTSNMVPLVSPASFVMICDAPAMELRTKIVIPLWHFLAFLMPVPQFLGQAYNEMTLSLQLRGSKEWRLAMHPQVATAPWMTFCTTWPYAQTKWSQAKVIQGH